MNKTIVLNNLRIIEISLHAYIYFLANSTHFVVGYILKIP